MDLRLLEDLRSISGTIIVKGGCLFNERLAQEVAGSAGKVLEESIWVEPFKSDWEKVLSESNYSIILEDKDDQNLIGDFFKKLKFPTPILDELESMKSKDYYTYRHIFMTTSLSIVLAKRLFKNDTEIKNLAHSALAHDFGKMRIPFRILKSSTKLSKKDYQFIYQHPIMGHLLLLHYFGGKHPFSADVALKHHEYPNRSGYPAGIEQKDEKIGIITVNDIFDALISPRSYRSEPFDIRGAIDFIWDGVKAGKLFERPAKCLIALNRKDKPDYNEISIHRTKRGFTPADTNYGPADEE